MPLTASLLGVGAFSNSFFLVRLALIRFYLIALASYDGVELLLYITSDELDDDDVASVTCDPAFPDS